MPYELGPVAQERAFRLQVLKEEGLGAKNRFLTRLESVDDAEVKERIMHAYTYAVGLQYDHVGLSSEAYLAHPLRVAEMALGLFKPVDADTVCIALLHNALEVGGVDVQALRAAFGTRIADTIATLTVDRSKQWEPEYKRSYYSAINAGYVGGRVIKVLDKLDNIFMLCLNADDAIRARYLAEIDEHVVPMAVAVMPQVGSYMKNASINASKIGYKPMK